MREPLLPLPPALDQLLVIRPWLELTLARVDEKISVVRAAEEERARRRPLSGPPDWWSPSTALHLLTPKAWWFR
ncbi:hypothetical protein [Streptomyces sp. DSM 41634]|uniref:hypothetical protein n=1 Tax=Streptomyces sp. DSM 41634 TaxID=3448656 RepID=UPI00403FF5A2